VAEAAVPIDKNAPLLVTTVSEIGVRREPSRFGRLLAEQVSARLTQQGYNVTDLKLRSDVYIREGTGELLLSKDLSDWARHYNAQVVVVGNYAVASGYIYITLKVVAISDYRVIAAVNYLLPIVENVDALLN